MDPNQPALADESRLRRDALVAQLRDELAARWTPLCELPGAGGSGGVATTVAAVAAGTVTTILTATEIERRTHVEGLWRALWPTPDITAPHPWWTTPLGRLVAAVRAHTTSPHAHVPNGVAARMLAVHPTRVTQLGHERKLERYPDAPGDITLRSIYWRLGTWCRAIEPDVAWDSRRSVGEWTASAGPDRDGGWAVTHPPGLAVVTVEGNPRSKVKGSVKPSPAPVPVAGTDFGYEYPEDD